jgi:hypothetical protein
MWDQGSDYSVFIGKLSHRLYMASRYWFDASSYRYRILGEHAEVKRVETVSVQVLT